MPIYSFTPDSVTYVYRPDGKALAFNPLNGAFIPEGDITDRLERLVNASGAFTGWRYRVASTDEVEIYDTGGRLLTIASRSGVIATLEYDPSGRLASVTDPFGKALAFGYDSSNRLTSLTIPGGQSYVTRTTRPTTSVASPSRMARLAASRTTKRLIPAVPLYRQR